MKDRLTITEIAKSLGITPRTIMRWEKSGKIKKSKRDWRGWRFYHRDDLDDIKKFYEGTYEYQEFNRSTANTLDVIIPWVGIIGILGSLLFGGLSFAETAKGSTGSASNIGVTESQQAVEISLKDIPVAGPQEPLSVTEAVKYTLGPDDIISIDVRRHPEFSGQYTINSEGKIEYKYVGDVIVKGLTKKELETRLSEVLGDYLLKPEINIQIVAYLSKVFYVIGEVNRPGKFYMRGDTITVREALIQAGLPTDGSATRKCRLITPDESGQYKFIEVNVFKLLYEGDLRENRIMKPGDVLYVPSTIIAKIIKVVSPVTRAVSDTAGAAAPFAAAAAL